MAFGHHLHETADASFQSAPAVFFWFSGLTLFGGTMVLFSRAFVRRRVIFLAATASVAATSLVMTHEPTSAQSTRKTMPMQYAADRPDHPGEAPFLSENQSAMTKMMTDMAVKPTGDIDRDFVAMDRDFVAMMVPHHQGAVDMARAELKYGHNKQLRRLAQTIVTNQQQQITAMRRAVGEPPLPSVAPPASEISPHPVPPAAMNMSDGSMK